MNLLRKMYLIIKTDRKTDHCRFIICLKILLIGLAFSGCADRTTDSNDPSDDILDPGDLSALFWIATSGPNNGEVHCMEVDSRGFLFVGTKSGRVFKSTNHGQTWDSFRRGLPGTAVHALLITGQGILFAATDSTGLYRTHIDTLNWRQSNLNDTTARALAMDSQGNIFAATAGGVFRSGDDGIRWETKNRNLDGIDVISFAINSRDKIFAGTRENGIFTSTDDGESWEQNSFGIGSVPSIMLNRFENVFLATSGFGTLISETNGDTWTVPINGLSADTVFTFSFNSAGFGFVSGAGVGVLRSTNNGFNWAPFNDSLTAGSLRSLILGKDEILYAGAANGIVYRTTRTTILP